MGDWSERMFFIENVVIGENSYIRLSWLCTCWKLLENTEAHTEVRGI